MSQFQHQPGLVIACGGTGGHLFPGLAVAEAWSGRGGRVLLLVSEKAIDREASRKYPQYSFETLPALPKPPSYSPRMLPFLWNLLRTVGRCRRLIDQFEADAVLGMGGFTSLPPVVAGRGRGLPGLVHDSNAVPGRANRVTARWCRRVLLGFADATPYFQGRACEVTGTPVRRELERLPPRDEAARHWGLDGERPVLLVIGGSQGARRLNTVVASAQLPEGFQVLHVAGPGDEARVRAEVEARADYRVLGFCDAMDAAYAVADVVVARSGASSLTELALLGLPSVLVPYPHAADDHQTHNARIFAAAGAAVLRPEGDLDPPGLVAAVVEVMSRRTEMGAAARGLAVVDAAERVCDAIAETLE